MPPLLVAFFNEKRVTTLLDFLLGQQLDVFGKFLKGAGGRDKSRENLPLAQNIDPAAVLARLAAVFAGAEPVQRAGAAIPPGSPSPVMPSKLPQSGGWFPPVYFVL